MNKYSIYLFCFLFLANFGIFATENDNYFTQNHHFTQYNSLTINDFVADNYGYIIVAANEGVFVYQPNCHSTREIEMGMEKKNCYALKMNGTDNVLLGLSGGLGIFNFITENFSFVPLPNSHNAFVVQIEEKTENEYFLRTSDGKAYFFNLKKNSIENIAHIQSYKVQYLKYDSGNLLFFADNSYVYQLEVSKNKMVDSLIVNNFDVKNITSVQKFSNQWWVHSASKLYEIQWELRQITEVITDFVPLALHSTENNLYFLSPTAIFTSKTPDGAFEKIIDFDHELVSSNFYKLSENKLNTLIVSGNKSMMTFAPKKPKANPVAAIGAIFINGHKLKPLDDSTSEMLIDSRIEDVNSISLQSTQNQIGISIYIPNYANDGSTSIAYLLEGYNDTWIQLPNSFAIIHFSNLKAGNYTLKVAANVNGKFDYENAKLLKISVKGSTLDSNWVLIFALALAFVSLFLFVIFRLKYSNIRKLELEEQVKQRTAELLMRNGEIENQNMEIKQQNEEIRKQHEEITNQNKKIQLQNEELEKHQHHLEDMVESRTIDLRNAMLKAEESDKLKTSFLANMSHEVRTPLNAIVGFASMLDTDDLSEQQKTDFMKLIYDNSENLLHLFEDIIDISKLESGTFDVNYTNSNVECLFTDLYQMGNDLKNLHNKIDIEFIWKSDSEMNELEIYTDKQRLLQIMVNLIDNAFKYTEHGSVEIGYKIIEKPANIPLVVPEVIGAKYQQKYIEFFVQDTGIGISTEHHSIIFERFRKVEGDFKKLYRGTGIGLAIANQITEIMGGKIWVDSELGRGTSFHFILPIFKLIETEVLYSEDAVLDGKTILLGEDERINIMYIEQVLANKNVQLIVAEDGKETMDMFDKLYAEKNIDLVLLDILMPDHDGYEVLKHIKKTDSAFPVVAQTAFAMQTETNKMREAGFDDIITKPYRQDALMNVILKRIR